MLNNILKTLAFATGFALIIAIFFGGKGIKKEKDYLQANIFLMPIQQI